MSIRSGVAGLVIIAAGVGVMSFGSQARADELFAVMVGGNQIPIGSGSVNGHGSASVMKAGNKICFAALVAGIDTPTEFHIHSGVAGTNGPDIIQFVEPGGPIQFTPGSPSTASGCISGVAKSTINAILQNPRNFYINVHTNQFPEGAIRGQLF
jgi:hypothetical protein